MISINRERSEYIYKYMLRCNYQLWPISDVDIIHVDPKNVLYSDNSFGRSPINANFVLNLPPIPVCDDSSGNICQ